MGELQDVKIRLASNPKVCQVIDIIVVDIPKAYDFLLSRDWSQKLQGYFKTGIIYGYHGKGSEIKLGLIGKHI